VPGVVDGRQADPAGSPGDEYRLAALCLGSVDQGVICRPVVVPDRGT
jgi:hypothetical protein